MNRGVGGGVRAPRDNVENGKFTALLMTHPMAHTSSYAITTSFMSSLLTPARFLLTCMAQISCVIPRSLARAGGTRDASEVATARTSWNQVKKLLPRVTHYSSRVFPMQRMGFIPNSRLFFTLALIPASKLLKMLLLPLWPHRMYLHHTLLTMLAATLPVNALQ